MINFKIVYVVINSLEIEFDTKLLHTLSKSIFYNEKL